jgi:hypothetical protein
MINGTRNLSLWNYSTALVVSQIPQLKMHLVMVLAWTTLITMRHLLKKLLLIFPSLLLIVDTNNITEIPDSTTLTRLAQLRGDVTINVITGSENLNQYNCPTYFTSAFPLYFPMEPANISIHEDNTNSR